MTASTELRRLPATTGTGPLRLREPARSLLTIGGLAVVAALLRLPYVHALVSSDEGGFLVVAGGWHAGGTSLYGDHWVDRPPLLLGIYTLATLTGGLPALRVLGALAVAATVFALGGAAVRIGGRRAGTVTAAVAAALLVSPVLGTVAVNGELLAAPFVATGVWAAIVACFTSKTSTVRFASLLTGAAAALAVLVKQNMVDVAVFGSALAVVMWRTRAISGDQLRGLVGWGTVGFAVAGGAVLGLAARLGSSPVGVLYAMYPFRVQAAQVMASVPWSERWGRITGLGEAFLVSVGPAFLVALVVLLVARRLDRSVRPPGVAVLALAAWDVVSILAGGSYWSHYLVQLVAPTALAAGLAATAGRRIAAWLRPVGVVFATSAAVAWVFGMHVQVDASGQTIGEAIRDASRPGDSVVSLLGDGDLVESSGLASPYPYLWSLPARTLDPQLGQLAGLLESPRAPTWLVVRGPGTLAYVDQRAAGAVVRDDYRLVGVVCGRSVYLHDGLQRAALAQPTSCRARLT